MIPIDIKTIGVRLYLVCNPSHDNWQLWYIMITQRE